MGTRRRKTKSDRCKKCKINYRLCFCEYLTPIEIKTPVQIIMHVGEVSLSSNTSNLLKQVHKNCTINIRGDLDNKVDYEKILMRETHKPLFLFPDDDAEILNQDYLSRLEKPVNLIVPDGTWRQAKKIKRRVAELKDITSINLPELYISKYKLRTPPREGMLSTFEAISKALGIIENVEIEKSLDQIFEIMNERVSRSRAGGIN